MTADRSLMPGTTVVSAADGRHDAAASGGVTAQKAGRNAGPGVKMLWVGPEDGNICSSAPADGRRQGLTYIDDWASRRVAPGDIRLNDFVTLVNQI